MKKKAISILVLLLLSSLVFYSCNDAVTPTDSNINSSQILEKKHPEKVTVTVFASGLNAPRGLKFGPDGYLYVSEAGLGGDISTDGLCDQVVAPIGPYFGGNSARILKISRSGNVSTVVDNLPSTRNSIEDRMGVADIEFIGHKLYALLASGGCSHGNPNNPASILRINNNGSWVMIADLSKWQKHHPTAVIEEDDFEPDGSWYSMINVDDDLYAIEPNHGEMVRVNPKNGHIKRVIDFSAHFGHIVPTAMDYHKGFYAGNLNTFPLTAGSSNIYKVNKNGHVTVFASGFTAVLGVAFDKKENLYVLETSSVDGFPTPNTGRVVKINHYGGRKVIVDSLFFPTGMTFGPDGAMYISNKGFGPPIPGFGEILKVEFKEHPYKNEDKLASGKIDN